MGFKLTYEVWISRNYYVVEQISIYNADMDLK